MREQWQVNVEDNVVSPVGVPAFDDVYAAAAVRERVGGVVEHHRAHASFACAFYAFARVGFGVGEPQSHGLFPPIVAGCLLCACTTVLSVPRVRSCSRGVCCGCRADFPCGMIGGMSMTQNNMPIGRAVPVSCSLDDAYGDVAAHSGGVFHHYVMRCPDEGDTYDGERVRVDVTRGTGYHTGMTRFLSATVYYEVDKDKPHGQRLSATAHELGTHYGVRMEVVMPAHVASLLASTCHVTPTGEAGIARVLDSGNALVTAFEDAMERTYIPTLVNVGAWLNARNRAVMSALSMLGQFDVVQPRDVLAQWRERVEAAVASAGVEGVPLAPVVEAVLGVLSPYRWFTYTVTVEGDTASVWSAAQSDENGYGELWALRRLIAEAWSARPSDEI